MVFTANTLYYQQLNEQLRSCPDTEIVVENLLGQRYLGCGSSGRSFRLYGTPGNGLGQYLNGSVIEVFGNAQDAAGDTMNDGKVQTSFTLPVKDDDKGAAAAVLMAQKMGLADPNVALRQKLDENFTFYVVYGSLTHTINYDEIVVQTVTDEVMDMHETDEFLKERLGRKLVVIGASTGTDAHTVGIDAIMNRKGFAGHYGLERYEMVEAYNLGSQIPNDEFLRKAAEVNADVVLVSQTVTQKDVHIQNLTELIELAEAEGVREKYIFCCGGARITHALAKELGYDAGFGAGTYADDVATFTAKELVRRLGK